MTRIEKHSNEEPQHSTLIGYIKLCITCQSEKDKMKLLTIVRKCRSE